MNKIRTVISGLFYPVTMMGYFIRALERRDDVELFLVGPYTGDWIPWGGGMRLPFKYVKTPNIPLPMELAQQPGLAPSFIESRLPWKPDLWLQIDAGWWLQRPDAGVVAHIATDPHCVSGDTMIATNEGLLYMDEAFQRVPLMAADKNGMSLTSGVWEMGDKITRTLVLETGQELTCTDDHLIKSESGEWKEASKFFVGDKIKLVCGTYEPTIKGNDNDYSIGFVIGVFQGDGSFGAHKSNIIRFTLNKNEKIVLLEKLKEHLFNGFGIDTVTVGKHHTSDNAIVAQVRRFGLSRFLKSLDLKSGSIPIFIRKGSRELIGGYIAGLFATDGCSSGGKLQITQKDEKVIRELQTILFYFGIPTIIRRIIQSSGFKPGNSYWILYVKTGRGSKIFNDLVGDIPDKAININSRRRGVNNSNEQEFKIVGILGAVKNQVDKRVSEPVYDIVNSETHSYLANGILVHNCLDYTQQRTQCDYFFNMQRSYMKEGDIHLPYAFDPTVHRPLDIK